MKYPFAKFVAFPFIIGLCVALFTGCGTLIPKKVEFGQSKVKAVPEITAKQKETQKVAARYVAVRTAQVEKAVAQAGITNASITAPVSDARLVAESLSANLGVPAATWRGTSTNLAANLDRDANALDRKIDAARDRQEKYVGKKIEGTGFLQIGYFTYLGCILGLLILIWVGLKIYGLFNPVVGLGMNTAGRVGSTVLSRAFGEVVAGGERFKSDLADSTLASDVKAQIAKIFTTAHQTQQSQDTQQIVSTITK